MPRASSTRRSSSRVSRASSSAYPSSRSHHQAALETAEIERDLSLVISRLEDFSAKVKKRLDDLDRSNMQDIIRNLVRRIEIDESHIEVIFRVPPPDGPSTPSPTDESGSWQHLYRRWSNAQSPGSIVAVVWPRIGKISTATPSRF
jgi:hypothetical protein